MPVSGLRKPIHQIDKPVFQTANSEMMHDMNDQRTYIAMTGIFFFTATSCLPAFRRFVRCNGLSAAISCSQPIRRSRQYSIEIGG